MVEMGGYSRFGRNAPAWLFSAKGYKLLWRVGVQERDGAPFSNPGGTGIIAQGTWLKRFWREGDERTMDTRDALEGK